MINIEIDFDEIREHAIDYIFAGAGHVANFVESLIDKVEEAAEGFQTETVTPDFSEPFDVRAGFEPWIKPTS
jgi:hypothetical protein